MGVRVDGGRYRVSPFPFIGEHTEALTVVVAFGGTYVLGWIAPYIWLTTRYRIGRTSLELCAGPIYQKLALRKIEMVLRTRQGVDLGFAFDSDFLWIGYPSSWGGYRVSPREREIFLELLDQRCAHLEMRDGELFPTGESATQ